MSPRRLASLGALVSLVGLAACAGPAPDGELDVRKSAVKTNVVVTVVDTNGTHQPGRDIEADKLNGTGVDWKTTGSQGTATFSLAANSYFFWTPGYGYEFKSANCTTPACTTASITVTEPVVVTVVDTNGAPEADVEVWAEDPNGDFVNLDDTDANGHATMSLPVGSYRFVTFQYGPTFVSGAPGSCVVPGCTTAGITMTVPVMVTVLDAQGNPIPNLPIWGETPEGDVGGWNVTNAQGQVSTEVLAGDWRFVTDIGGTTYTSGAPGSCTVPGCTSVTIAVPPPVVVTVVDGGGNPIAGKEVVAENECWTTEYGTTDSGGHASFTVAPGQWRFRASCGCETFYSGTPGSCVVPGCTTAQIVMVCGGCTGQPDGTACNDGNACTQTDTCQSGGCVGSNPVTCAAQDQCHVAGTCSPSTGCSNPPIADGTACNDGDLCTQTDACQAGTCTGSNPVTCTAQDQCHVAGTCAPGTGVCSNPPIADGTTCNDGDLCTQTDACQAGTCQSSGAYPVILNLPVDELGMLGGTQSIASAINASGRVVGGGPNAGGVEHAFSWTEPGPIVDLGTQMGLSSSGANDINDDGVVVGSSDNGRRVPSRLSLQPRDRRRRPRTWWRRFGDIRLRLVLHIPGIYSFGHQ